MGPTPMNLCVRLASGVGGLEGQRGATRFRHPAGVQIPPGTAVETDYRLDLHSLLASRQREGRNRLQPATRVSRDPLPDPPVAWHGGDIRDRGRRFGRLGFSGGRLLTRRGLRIRGGDHGEFYGIVMFQMRRVVLVPRVQDSIGNKGRGIAPARRYGAHSESGRSCRSAERPPETRGERRSHFLAGAPPMVRLVGHKQSEIGSGIARKNSESWRWADARLGGMTRGTAIVNSSKRVRVDFNIRTGRLGFCQSLLESKGA